MREHEIACTGKSSLPVSDVFTILHSSGLAVLQLLIRYPNCSSPTAGLKARLMLASVMALLKIYVNPIIIRIKISQI